MRWARGTARSRALAFEREIARLCLWYVALLGVASPEAGRAQPEPSAAPAPALVAAAQPSNPPIARDDAASTDEGRVVDIPVLANDRAPEGGTLSLVSITQPEHGWVLINGDDTLRYQPHTGFTGVDAFSYSVADPSGATASAGVRVAVADVSDAPVAENQALETDEDIALAITLVGIDADGDPLRFEIARPPEYGSLSGEPPAVLYVPQADYHGLDGFVFSVHDDRGGSDTGSVLIQINSVADVPIAVDDVAATDEGRVVDIPVLANDHDPDGDVLHIVSVAQPPNGWVLVNGDDTLRYQPHTGFAGVDGFAYTVADADGVAASAAVWVAVADVADAPVAENQTLRTDEDVALAITLVGVDADGDALRFQIDRPPTHGSLSGALPDVVYIPEADYHGVDGFVFSVHDDRGDSDVGVVSIRVYPVADAPLAEDDEAATDEGRVVDIPVLANDHDPDGDVLHMVSIAQPPNGWVLINGDDTLRYQPHTGFSGVDGFAYTIADIDGATASAVVRVAVRRAPRVRNARE